MTDVKFSALVRGAFGGDRYADQDIMVSLDDSTVRVWDDVAGHYTLCHSLTKSQQRRLRAMPVVRAARKRGRCD